MLALGRCRPVTMFLPDLLVMNFAAPLSADEGAAPAKGRREFILAVRADRQFSPDQRPSAMGCAACLPR